MRKGTKVIPLVLQLDVTGLILKDADLLNCLQGTDVVPCVLQKKNSLVLGHVVEIHGVRYNMILIHCQL